VSRKRRVLLVRVERPRDFGPRDSRANDFLIAQYRHKHVMKKGVETRPSVNAGEGPVSG